MDLATLNGASIKNAFSEFANDKPHVKKAVIFDEMKTELPASKANRIKNAGYMCVNKAWFLDSLACFSILDAKTYETYT